MYYRYNGVEILNDVITPYNDIKNLNFLLMRHGESESNALQAELKQDGKLLDEELKIEDAIIPLTKKGEEQAIDLGKKLKLYMENNNITKEQILIIISPYERARKTFELANSELKFDYNTDNIFVLNDLREQSYGAFHMISKEVKKQIYEKIYNECQRNTISYFKPQFLGESPADVSNRLWNVINFIREYSKNTNINNVFVFGHGNVNRCLLMNILNLPPEFYDDFKRGENSSVINIKDGKYNEIKDFN